MSAQMRSSMLLFRPGWNEWEAELTGLDFFAGLPDTDEALLEGTDGGAVWQVLLTQ